MAITCPKCGVGFDVTLFQFGHRIRCDCGAVVELEKGHVAPDTPPDDPVPHGRVTRDSTNDGPGLPTTS
ncbi:MAG: hypothetical protein HQ581_26075 [Planctomycetes bacterium]|nr:hypothetical protein [Planctomycetota bacterium]